LISSDLAKVFFQLKKMM